MKKLFDLFSVLLLVLSFGCASRSEDGYYAIDHFYIKEEGDAFAEIFNKAVVDVYNWYRSIEGEDGVYILHSDHYDTEMLREWKASGIYNNVPAEGFWYFVVSENYLRDRGFELSSEESEKIASGIRLYLLPGNMTEEERLLTEEFLKEDAHIGLDTKPMIETAFQEDPVVEFRTYQFDGTLETEEEGEIKNPVILVCSSANMKYFESESLIATGKRDSYIKLTAAAYQRFAGKALPEELQEIKLTFLPLNRIEF